MAQQHHQQAGQLNRCFSFVCHFHMLVNRLIKTKLYKASPAELHQTDFVLYKPDLQIFYNLANASGNQR